MYRTFCTLVVLGLILWGFLMLHRYGFVGAPSFSGEFDDATTADRCAEFRTEIDTGLEGEQAEDGTWSYGYGGRIRQIVNGCF